MKKKMTKIVAFSLSGDTDSVVPVTATRYSIDALKLPTLSQWHPWYDNGKVSRMPNNNALRFIQLGSIFIMPSFTNIGWRVEPIV